VGAGQVTVIITVNNQGKVIDAKVDNGSSSGDGCLRAFATRAARMSLFNASTTAPARQMGTITYAFIAQ
jgi:TonB family protein